MALDSDRLLLVGLIEAELPGHTIRLCDGGFLNWPGRGLFTSSDPVFGTIDSIESLTDKIADEAPAGRLTLLPPDTSGAVELASAEAQNSPMRFWLAEADHQTGELVGTPELLFDGFLDTVTLMLDQGTRTVEIEFVAAAERLFSVKEGNVLSPAFHKKVWPGETGFDNATGVNVLVAWGVAGPPRGSSYAGSGGMGGSTGNSFVDIGRLYFEAMQK